MDPLLSLTLHDKQIALLKVIGIWRKEKFIQQNNFLHKITKSIKVKWIEQ